MTDQKITFKYVLACAGAVCVTWILHEFTHWITSESLGYESIMRLNSVSPAPGQEQTSWHNVYISAAGPIITIIQAIVMYVILMKTSWNKLIYPLLFTPFYMRFLAALMNFIKPNDEGRISEFLELGLFTLPLIVSALLLFLVYKTSKKYALSWKFNILTYLLIALFSSILILSDQFMKIRIL